MWRRSRSGPGWWPRPRRPRCRRLEDLDARLDGLRPPRHDRPVVPRGGPRAADGPAGRVGRGLAAGSAWPTPGHCRSTAGGTAWSTGRLSISGPRHSFGGEGGAALASQGTGAVRRFPNEIPWMSPDRRTPLGGCSRRALGFALTATRWHNVRLAAQPPRRSGHDAISTRFLGRNREPGRCPRRLRRHRGGRTGRRRRNASPAVHRGSTRGRSGRWSVPPPWRGGTPTSPARTRTSPPRRRRRTSSTPPSPTASGSRSSRPSRARARSTTRSSPARSTCSTCRTWRSRSTRRCSGRSPPRPTPSRRRSTSTAPRWTARR